ncbi:MAG: hypothetical protein F6K62_22095 [Sphaerospermopsis sp. SIO1G2]|nr:hypothetical protein [Sphaerospermopsis sp. SIO1G2]
MQNKFYILEREQGTGKVYRDLFFNKNVQLILPGYLILILSSRCAKFFRELTAETQRSQRKNIQFAKFSAVSSGNGIT